MNEDILCLQQIQNHESTECRVRQPFLVSAGHVCSFKNFLLVMAVGRGHMLACVSCKNESKQAATITSVQNYNNHCSILSFIAVFIIFVLRAWGPRADSSLNFRPPCPYKPNKHDDKYGYNPSRKAFQAPFLCRLFDTLCSCSC